MRSRARNIRFLGLFTAGISACGALSGQRIDSACGTKDSSQKATGPILALGANDNLANKPPKPMWIGAVIETKYSKKGLYEQPAKDWSFTEPDFCSGLVEFYKTDGRYSVRLATSRSCALIVKQATPIQTLKISGQSAIDLGFDAYLSLNIENPNFTQIRNVLGESFGKVAEPIRSVLMDANVDSYPYITIGSRLNIQNEKELLRLACHTGSFLTRDSKAGYPTPEECMPVYWMEVSRSSVSDSDAKTFSKELDQLVAATQKLREMRKATSKFDAPTTAHLDSMIDSFEKMQNSQLLIDTWGGPRKGSLDCPIGYTCSADSRRNAFDIYAKYILPEAASDLALLRDDPKSTVALANFNKKVSELVEARNAAFVDVFEGLKLISPTLKDHQSELSFLGHHITTPLPQPGMVTFKPVALPFGGLTSEPETLGVRPTFDNGRLFLNFNPAGNNLRNVIHEGTALMLGDYPITFLRVPQKHSEGAALMPLPERKVKSSSTSPNSSDKSNPQQSDNPKSSGQSCAVDI